MKKKEKKNYVFLFIYFFYIITVYCNKEIQKIIKYQYMDK